MLVGFNLTFTPTYLTDNIRLRVFILYTYLLNVLS
jgi:hypothetical protein